MSDDDFGFTTVPSKPVTVEVTVEDRLERVKKLVLPLINNLMKDPDKDIHWPDRDKKLMDFKVKLLAIIDGPEEDK